MILRLFFCVYYDLIESEKFLQRRRTMGKSKLRSRDEIPAKYKWNMQDMFATDELWESEAQMVLDMAKEMELYKGRLSESASVLLEYLKKMDEIGYHATRVHVYANQKYHEDTAIAKYQGYSAKADDITVAVNSATSFTNPEILSMDETVLEQFFKEEPALEKYRRVISEITRTKAHIRSEEVEGILAQAKDMAVAPYNIYSV